MSEVVAKIEEKMLDETQAPVFMLKDIRQMYQDRLRNLGIEEEIVKCVNATRLKEDIIQYISGLCERRNGKFVVLTVEDDVGKTLLELSQNSLKDDSVVISKTARIIRKALFSSEENFDGDFSYERQKSSVSSPLLHLISLILHGDSILAKKSNENPAAINLAQLLRFNSVRFNRRSLQNTRHSKSNEPPFPVKIGLMIFAKTKKKSLVNLLCSEGLSISYSRVQEIQATITKQMCEKYKQEDIVCPPSLTKGLFTTAAINNIDHNPSSATAKTSFHGTSISIFQHLESKNTINKVLKISSESELSSLKPSLPKHFTEISPIKSGKSEYPHTYMSSFDDTFDDDLVLGNGKNWLEQL